MTFTPFRIEDAQSASPSPLITAHKVGVLNEKRCNSQSSPILYKIIIQNRDYSSFYIINTINNIIIDDIPINPIQNKMFSNDLFLFPNNLYDRTDKSLFDNIIIHSSPIKNKEIPGILILENNKTFGRTANKKRLFYKCIPHDKQLPVFLVPYEIQLGFNKVFKNKYVVFKFDQWTGQHPQGLLLQTLGNIDELPIFYEYQLYCRELHHSMIRFIQHTKKITENNKMITSLSSLRDPNGSSGINNSAGGSIVLPNSCFTMFLETTQSFANITDDRTISHNVFSIDPQGSTDIDDAFSIRKTEDGFYEISIYIAHVYSWLESLELWDHLSERVATIYLPDKRRPLLPTILSENLCSLLMGKNRMAMTMTIYVDTYGIIHYDKTRFSNSLICVYKNYNYTQIENVDDPNYQQLLETTRMIPKKDNNTSSITNSKELVAYWMIFMNHSCANILKENNTGIFRSSTAIDSMIPTLWNQFSGNYVLINDGKENNKINHDSLGIEYYIHITSPIRRLVDIINQTLLLKHVGCCIPSEKAEKFITQCFLKIDTINQQMKNIRKIQCDCNLVYNCFTDPTIMQQTYNGIICEKIQTLSSRSSNPEFMRNTTSPNGDSIIIQNQDNDNLDIEFFHYIVYLEDISLMSRIKCKENLEIKSIHSFKIFLFEDEDKIQKKIRIQRISSENNILFT